MTKIWIYNDIFVPVDEFGYLSGPYYEGALGVVVPMLGTRSKNEKYALKIPRMLADTIRENAFIAKVTEDESDVVHKIQFEPEGAVGLMATKLDKHPLRLQRALLKSKNAEAKAQDGHVILVSFNKGRPPRFCTFAVLKDDKGSSSISVCPKEIADEMKGIARDWDEMVNCSRGEADSDNEMAGQEFSETVCHISNPDAKSSACLLNSTISARITGPTWYAAVPSIAYEWGSGTIERAVSDGVLSGWNLAQCFMLFRTVLTGLNTLHAGRLMHGDLRPANIMAVGDRSRPDRYKLIDYGSFASNKTGPGSTTGNTMAGAGLGQQRVTPFYSPERRAGVERESADTAIILQKGGKKEKGGGEYLIKIGWRAALIGPDGQRADPEAVKGIRTEGETLVETTEASFSSEEPNKLNPEDLYAGDRLRLQDYLFEIIASRKTSDTLLCRCRPRYAKVFHDRLAVYNADGDIPDETVLSLPRYVEYRQWSAASDIYSVGAVFLYCLFTSSPGLTKPGRREKRSVQACFSELIEILENVSYFNAFWPELEEFRGRLETYYDEHEDTNGAGAADVELGTDEKDEHGQPLTMRSFAVRAANNVVQSAPHAKIILARCDDNLAKFLLFLHFVLSCLHRRADMTDEARRKTSGPGNTEPFCKSRLDQPSAKTAQVALSRIEKLESLLGMNAMFGAFLCRGDNEVPDFNPQSDPVVRLNNQRLENKLTRIREECVRWQEKGRTIKKWSAKNLLLEIIDQELPKILNLDAYQVHATTKQASDADAPVEGEASSP